MAAVAAFNLQSVHQASHSLTPLIPARRVVIFSGISYKLYLLVFHGFDDSMKLRGKSRIKRSLDSPLKGRLLR